MIQSHGVNTMNENGSEFGVSDRHQAKPDCDAPGKKGLFLHSILRIPQIEDQNRIIMSLILLRDILFLFTSHLLSNYVFDLFNEMNGKISVVHTCERAPKLNMMLLSQY